MHGTRSSSDGRELSVNVFYRSLLYGEKVLGSIDDDNLRQASMISVETTRIIMVLMCLFCGGCVRANVCSPPARQF
jgi:hypothetical protein